MTTLSQSPDLAARPPEINLRDYLDIIRRRKGVFVQVFVLVLVVGLVILALSKPIYQAKAELLVPEPNRAVNLVDSNKPTASVLVSSQPDSVATQILVLQSQPFLNAAFRQAGVRKQFGDGAPKVKVEGLDPANVIEITVEGESPREVARLANTIVDLHLEQTDAVRNKGLRTAIDFVRSETAKAARQLNETEQKLIAFRNRYQPDAHEAEQEARTKEYLDYQARIREAQSDITSTRAQIDQLRARLEKQQPTLVEAGKKENPRYAKLREKLDDLKIQRVELLKDYKETSPRIQALDKQIAAFTDQLGKESPEVEVRSYLPNPTRAPMQVKLGELEAALEGYQAAYNAAAAQLEARKSVMAKPTDWQVQLSRLTQDRDAAQSAYRGLADHLRELEIRGKLVDHTARPIERAEIPTDPVRPRKATGIALSVILALCIATGAAFLYEFMDDRVSSPDDLERVSQLPTLGQVPLIPPDHPRLMATLPDEAHVIESYRALRSSIGFAGIDAPIRRLQVTSAHAGEGKSLTSVNLAVAMAMDGKKVILVDGDLRRPTVHRLLNLPSAPGLTDVLIGLCSVEEALQPTDVANLKVMCAGASAPNPAELFGSRNFEYVIEHLESRADIVIFDSSPCIPVTDPMLIAARMDGVLLVLHVGQTRKAAVKQATEMLQRARARIVGLVYNRVQRRKKSASYDSYYYTEDSFSDMARRGEGYRRNGAGRPPAITPGSAVVTADFIDEDEA